MRRFCIILILCGACAAMTLPEFVEKYLKEPGINLRYYAKYVAPAYPDMIWKNTKVIWEESATQGTYSDWVCSTATKTVIHTYYYHNGKPRDRQWYVEPKPAKPVTTIDPNSIEDPMLRAVVKKLLEAK